MTTMTTNTKTLLTVKTDKSLKRAAQETADEIGISLGTLVNSFLKQLVRTKEVNFSVSYTPNASLRASIAQAEKDYREGKLPKAVGVHELIKELRS